MLSTQSTAPDPIFGAIEAHRRAHADFCEAALAADGVDTSPEAIAARQGIAQLGMDVEQRYDETNDAELEAQTALVSIEPTTIEGAIELLRYASSIAWFGGRDLQECCSWEPRCFRHVADALSRIAAR
jgi:hypothetical protein